MAFTPTIAGISSIPEAEGMLEGLVRTNMVQMRGGGLPPLYGGTIRYVAERPRRRGMRAPERWQTAIEVARTGRGDCEDLAAYAAAQLRLKGVPARVRVRRTGRRLWHAVVRTPRGWIDPSRRLGMRGAG